MGRDNIHVVVVRPEQLDGSPVKANKETIVTSTKRNTTSRHILLTIHGARLDRLRVCITKSASEL